MTQMLLEIGTGEARPYRARHWIPVALRGIAVKTLADMAEACGTGLVETRRITEDLPPRVQVPSCLPHLLPLSSPFPSLNCALIG